MVRIKHLPLLCVEITSPFGMRDLLGMWWHNGVDAKAHIGINVYAVDDGIVKVSHNNKNGYGNYIVIDHGNYASLYAHLSISHVVVGDIVRAGNIIGLTGATGQITGPHLHFEIRLGKYTTFWDRCKTDTNVFMRCVDPTPFIQNLLNIEDMTVEQAKKVIQINIGYDDITMAYLSDYYKYSEPMLLKMAKAIK